jgi:hypothetical protein
MKNWARDVNVEKLIEFLVLFAPNEMTFNGCFLSVCVSFLSPRFISVTTQWTATDISIAGVQWKFKDDPALVCVDIM